MTRLQLSCVLMIASAWLVMAARARAEPVRILLAVGQNIGGPDDEPLRYAERDAERFAQLFTRLGDVERQRTYVVTNATAENVRRVLTEIRGRTIELRDVTLLVYISSHADSAGLRLADSHLPYSELRSLVAAVPARLKVVFTDACTSGVLIRNKGGKTVRPFAIDLESGQQVEGQMLITSTGPSEPAQEWEALGGGLFTHHLLSGLRGAADRDGNGRVTLFEAYSHAYEHTLSASTTARAGSQHPAHEIDLSGKGDVTLTRPGGRQSALAFAPGTSGRYVVTAALGGELIAELDKAPGRSVRLALEPGRYLVRKPEGAFVRVGEAVVLPDTVSDVRDEDMAQVPYAEVARRGPTLPHVWSLELGLDAHNGVIEGAGVTPGLALMLQRDRGPLELAGGVQAARTEIDAQNLTVVQYEMWARGEVRLRMPLGLSLPYAGLSVSAGMMQQTLTRDQERAIRDTFGASALPRRTGAAGRLELTLGVELPLTTRFTMRIGGSVGASAARVERGLRLLAAAGAQLAVSTRF
jgi:hypothetical protein